MDQGSNLMQAAALSSKLAQACAKLVNRPSAASGMKMSRQWVQCVASRTFAVPAGSRDSGRDWCICKMPVRWRPGL